MNFDNCILYIRSKNELRLLIVYDIIVLYIKENIFEKVWWLYAVCFKSERCKVIQQG